MEGGLERFPVEAVADDDEPRAVVLVGPRIEVHGRVDGVLHAADEERAFAADVEQSLDAEDLLAATASVLAVFVPISFMGEMI